jgi:hypothetical protein
MWPSRLSRLTSLELAGLLCVGLLALYASVAVAISEPYVAYGTCLSADAHFYAHESTRGTAIFDTQTGKMVFRSEPGWRAFFSPSATRVGLSRGGIVRVRALSTGDIEHRLVVGDDERLVAFIDDDRLVVVKSNSLEHWSLAEEKRTVVSGIQAGPRVDWRHAAIARNGRRVAFGESRLENVPNSGAGEWWYDIDAWEMGEPARRWELVHDMKGSAYELALSNDGKLLAAYVSEGLRGSVKLWNLNSDLPAESKSIGASHAFAFSPDSSKLAIADWRWPSIREFRASVPPPFR